MSGYSITYADMSRETLTDNGDGSGMLEVFDPEGVLISSTSVTLPVPPQVELTAEERIAALEADLAAALALLQGGS